MTKMEKWSAWENTASFEMFTSTGLEDVSFRGPFEGYR